jgi:hypothetical protein
MKALAYAVVLLACVGLSLVGCTDQAQSPVAPTDQLSQAPASLQKSFFTEFTATSDPTGQIGEFITKLPDGKVMMRGVRNTVQFTATILSGPLPDLLTGPGEVEINGTSDYNTGEGQWYGKLKLMPTATAALGGKWEFVWHGKATIGPTLKYGPGWIIPLQEEGHGSGGSLTGMQGRMELIITAPMTLTTWTGQAHGFIISH